MDMNVLRSVSFLQDLTDDELKVFAGLVDKQTVPAKIQIVQEGREIDAFYIIGRGTVHVRRMAQKREVLLGRIPTGGFFGEINMFDPGLATASIYAMDEVELWVISYEKMRSFMEAHPAAGYKIVSTLMTEMSRRLRQTNDRLVNTVYWTSLSSTPR